MKCILPLVFENGQWGGCRLITYHLLRKFGMHLRPDDGAAESECNV